MFLEDRFYQKVLKSNLKRKTNELTIMSLNFTTNKSFIFTIRNPLSDNLSTEFKLLNLIKFINFILYLEYIDNPESVNLKNEPDG